MSRQTDSERLIYLASEKAAKTDLLEMVEEASGHLQVRMVHHANIIETERHVRFSQRMQRAADEVFWTAVISVITLGSAAAVEAIMAANYAVGTTAGAQYAVATARMKDAAGVANKLRTLFSSSEVWGVYAEHIGCKLMLSAPSMLATFMLSRAENVHAHTPGTIRNTYGPSESKFTLFHYADLLRAAYSTYKIWEHGQLEEKQYYERMLGEARVIYANNIEAKLNQLPEKSRHFIGMNGMQFGQIDDRINAQVTQAVRTEMPEASDVDRRQAMSHILRTAWMREYETVQTLIMPLQVEIKRLDQQIRQLRRQMSDRGPVTVGGRVLDYQMAPY